MTSSKISFRRAGFCPTVSLYASLLLALITSGCAPRISVVPDLTALRCREVVVVVPGYKGTALANDAGDIRWVSVREILFGRRSIPRSGVNAEPLRPAGMLRTIPLGFGVDFYDAYDSTLKPLENEYPGCVIPFAYDWRGSNADAAEELRTLLESLRSHGAEQIAVVGHSMGGMVTTLMLRTLVDRPYTGGRLIDGVVLAGVPFRGTVFLLRDFKEGVVTVVNRSLLTPETVHTFYSAYELLPPPGSTVVVDEAQCPGPGIYAAENWDRLKWDSCRAASGEALELCRAERVDGLSRSAAVHERILGPAPVKLGIPILVIRGIGQPTLARALLRANDLYFPADSQREDPQFSPFFDDGDGTVTTESAAPTALLNSIGEVEQVKVHLGHDRLISLEPGKQSLAAFLRRIFESGRGHFAAVAHGKVGDHTPH